MKLNEVSEFLIKNFPEGVLEGKTLYVPTKNGRHRFIAIKPIPEDTMASEELKKCGKRWEIIAYYNCPVCGALYCDNTGEYETNEQNNEPLICFKCGKSIDRKTARTDMEWEVEWDL